MLKIDVNNISEKILKDGAVYIGNLLDINEIETLLNDFKFKSIFNLNNSFTNNYENQKFITQPFLNQS